MRPPVALAFAVILFASGSLADSPDPAKADALFREARALMKQGEFRRACPKLAESQRLDPAAGTLINLGECREKLGVLADALQSYRDALAQLLPSDPRIAPVRQEIAAIERRVPQLTVRLARGVPEGTKVRRDGVELSGTDLGAALPVNPGEHWIVVVAPGREDARRKVALTEGAHRVVIAEPGQRRASLRLGQDADRSESKGALAPKVPEGGPQRTAGFFVGGIGFAALAGAGYIEFKLYRECQPDRTCAPDTYALVKWDRVLWAVGAVGVGVGAYLVLTDDPAAGRETAISADALPGGAGLSIRGSY